MAEAGVTSISCDTNANSFQRVSSVRSHSSPGQLSKKVLVPDGYKRTPRAERLTFGQDFPHLNILRDVCKRTIGGEDTQHESKVATKYNLLYGPKDNLKENTDSKIESGEIEQNSRNSLAGSCPSLFDRVFGRRNCSMTETSLRHPLKGKQSDPVPRRKCVEQLQAINLCDLEICVADILADTLQQRRDTYSKDDCLRIASNQSLSSLNSVKPTLGKLSKKSFEDIISFYTTKETDVTARDVNMQANNRHRENKCRVKIDVQYFSSTRQLRIMLHKVEGLNESNCDIQLKLALVSSTSKQKAMSRKIHVNCTNVVLNEVVYMEPQDGKVIGKLLRLRLCKVSKYFRRLQLIGETEIVLDDLDVSVDTSMWLTLNKELPLDQYPSACEVEIVLEHSDVSASGRLTRRRSLSPADLQLLIENSPACHMPLIRQ